MKNECSRKAVTADNISDADIYSAMKAAGGYLDITPGDFKELYRLAYDHALERIRTTVKAKDIMTTKVHTVAPGLPLQEVAALMAKHRIAGLPVVTPENRVLGMISEQDFLSHMGSGETISFMGVVANCLGVKHCAALGIRGRTAEDIMTSPVISVSEATPVSEVTALLTRHRINRAPVLNAAQQLAGIVSRADIIAASL